MSCRESFIMKILKADAYFAFLSVLIPGLLQLFYILSVIKYVDNTHYGLFVQLQAYSNLFINLFGQMANESLVRFINHTKFKNDILSDLISLSLVFYLFIFFILVVVSFLIENIDLVQMSASLSGTSIFMASGLFISYAMMAKTKKRYFYIRIADGLCRYIIPVVLYIYYPSLYTLLFGFIIASIFSFIISLKLIGDFDLKFRIRVGNLIEYFKFSYQTVPASLSIWAITSLDKLLIERFWGLRVLGQYTKMVNLASILQPVSQIYGILVNPKLFYLLENKSLLAYEYLRKTLIALGFLILSMVVVILIIVDDLVYFLESVGYLHDFGDILLFKLLLIASSIAILQNSLAVIASLEKKLFVNTIVYTLASFLGLAIIYFFGERSVLYVGYASLISYSLMVILFLVIWRKIIISPKRGHND
jgi:O-antigen/teichoic acid export membrane protein